MAPHSICWKRRAGLGIHKRAIDKFERGLELAPENDLSRLQPGTLNGMCDLPDEAIEAWQSLERVGENEPLYLLKRGLEYFVADDYPACISDLTRRLKLIVDNPSLNDDMAHMLSEARKALVADPDSAAQAPDAALKGNGLLHAYPDSNPPSED